MTTPFRLESVRIETVNGPFVIEFPAHLTVLAGATGVGKTTLLELIKFGLGGDGLLAPVVETSVSEVHLDVQVGRSRFALSRPISEKGRKHVRVVDLVSGDRLPDRAVDNNQENSISDLLMTALGLPTDMRAAPRGKNSSSKGHRITFNDVFKYMYVS